MIGKELGRTGVRIPALAQGCGFNQPLSVGEIRSKAAALRYGIELGLTLIDTAEAYGDGTSEEMVAEAIQGQRDRVMVSTKVSPENLTRDALRRAAEASLRRLRTDYIDLYQIHWPNPAIPMEETMDAMQALIDKGKVRYCGLSNFSMSALQGAQEMLESHLIVSNQVEYNLIDRSAELEMLPFCEAHRITMFAYSPLVRAKSAISDRRAAAMGMIAARYHCSVPQIMLAWLMRQTCVVPIVKSFTPENITRNIEAAAINLAPEDAAEVSRLFAQQPLTLEPARIRVVQNPEENRRFYETFSEAMENPCGYTPSPRALAEALRRGEILKPIKVVRSSDPNGRFEFDLVEGQVRYWAHVFAFGEHEPIKALLRDG